MLYFTSQNAISAILRQTYTGNKSAYSSVGTGSGYLRPLDEAESSLNNVQYGRGYTLIVECGIDIREADKVTISGITYLVRGVANHNRGSVPYKKCLVVLPENA